MSCRLREIFDRQEAYLASLRPIYHWNGFYLHTNPFPWPLSDRDYQEEFRLLAWRCTEEVIELVELYFDCTDHFSAYQEKFNEEVADTFHFFVELCLATGVTVVDLCQEFSGRNGDYLSGAFDFCGQGNQNETIPQRWWLFVYKLGLAMHKLRQRPWRTDDRPTDPVAFKAAMIGAFLTFISACKRSGIDADALYNAYFAKGKINDQRTADQKL